MANVAERNLLIALEVLQKKLVDERGLRDALQAWADDRSRSLLDVLQENGRLSPERRRKVEQAVDLHAGEPGTAPMATVVSSTPEVASGPRFEKVAPHAAGGLGIVSRGRDRQLDRDVAIKEIKEDHADQVASRARFRREALTTAQLEHPGIIAVHGYWEDASGRPAYAMQFVEGRTLRDAINAFHGDPGEETERLGGLHRLLRSFVDMCQTIAYAHSRGVIHRDLKPANVLLGPFGQTLIADWGLAKVFDVDRFGTTLEPDAEQNLQTIGPHGTPHYWSPEQAAGRTDGLSPATDIYSLGATLYDLLTGSPPPLWAEKLAPPEMTPAPLIAVCRKALAADPKARYASAADLGEDVSRWMAGEPVSVWSEPLAARARQWLHRVTTELIAGPAALDLYGQVLGLLRTRRGEEASRAELAAGFYHLGLVLTSAGRHEEAAERFDAAAKAWTELLALAPDREEVKAGFLRNQFHFGQLLDQLGQPARAVEQYLRGANAISGSAGDARSESPSRPMLLLLSAHIELSTGQLHEAIDHARELIAVVEQSAPANRTWRTWVMLGNAWQIAAKAHSRQNQPDEALAAQERACESLEKWAEERPEPVKNLRELFAAQQTRALLARKTLTVNADSHLGQAIRTGERLLALDDQPDVRHALSTLYFELGKSRASHPSALSLFDKAEALLAPSVHPENASLLADLRQARTEAQRIHCSPGTTP